MIRIALVPACILLALFPACSALRGSDFGPMQIAEITPRLRFLHSYPYEAAAIPELGALLRAEGLASLAESRRDSAAQGRRPRSGPDEVEQLWEVTADTPDLLALSSTVSTYQDGSAHGYYAFRSLIWGRSAGRPLKLSELFPDRKGVAHLMADLCARLMSAREARSRERGRDRPAPMACPSVGEADIVPLAERGGRIRSFRMRLTGDETPDGYAGGSYEVEAVMTPGLLALIDPALRDSFLGPSSLPGSGGEANQPQ